MDPSEEVSKSLIKWLQTLIPTKSRTVMDISDGVAMLQALVQIAPEHFSRLEPKIKTDVGSIWRVKVSNLKKIVESLVEYYQDVLNLQILDVGKPDVGKIGEQCDLIQLGKLLRLILGCAVNCERKQEYITQIMSMEESLQQCIMQAIQQLEELTGGPGRSCLSLVSLTNDSTVLRLMDELNAANESKETLAQQCYNLEMQVQALQEEKQALQTDMNMLSAQLKDKEAFELTRSPESRRQMDLLKEELFKVETMRDDYRAKILEQEKQIVTLQEKISELQLESEAVSRLKDEVDALSESADKVKALEITVASYKKKLEDYADVKKQLKVLEGKNTEYIQQNMKYEEELNKHSVWKNQCELYKSQASELQQKLDEETQKADKALFQSKNLESKLIALQNERDRLIRERDTLRDENEELKLGRQTDDAGAAMAQELTPTEMKERLRFLERENKTLRLSSQEAEARQDLLNDASQRLEKLQEQNRNLNQRVLELEAQLEEHQKGQREEQTVTALEAALKEYKQKCALLQETLNTKESELHASQAKYNRSVDKARQVAQSLESKSNSAMEAFKSASMKEMEEKLLTTAFYRLGLTCQREAVDERLALLSAGQGQSFLARQRQPTPRKPVQTFKSK